MLDVIGVPIASSYLELQRVPALLVAQKLKLLEGKQDAAEFAALKAEAKANKKK